MSNPCCCASGAAVSGEEPEFTRRCCPVHRDPSGDLCRHHKREADEAEGLAARLRCSVMDCEADAGRRSGMCQYHRQMKHRTGGTTPQRERPGQKLAWLKEVAATETDECVYHPRMKGRWNVKWDGSYISCYRFICIWVFGPPKHPKMQAAHSCGNGHLGCTNPKHLRWATHLENIEDKILQGRTTRGERSASAKLTESQVIEIRMAADAESAASLAKRYGVSRATISDIIQRRRWEHVV